MKPEEEGYLFFYRLDDGRIVGILPLTFGRARIVITTLHNPFVYEDLW